MSHPSRRKLITTSLAAAAGVTGLAAAARLARRYGLIPPDSGGIFGPGATLTYAAQRLLTRHSLAREFSRDQISPAPFANGAPPKDETFARLQAGGFSDWRLEVDGLVARPGSFSLAELKSHPSRSQITHLACEEGWSYIAEWTGVPLSHVLSLVGILPQAKYVVYFLFDRGWWDSVDMADALHPQTLVTYSMNGGELPVGHGGPLRLRVPRQLGYKSVKYINRLTVTDNLKGFGVSGRRLFLVRGDVTTADLRRGLDSRHTVDSRRPTFRGEKMRRGFRFGLLSAVLCLLAPVAAFAGIVVAPEIDPASAAGGLALVISSAALILERRRRR